MEKVKEFAKFYCNSYSSLDSIKEAMLEKFKMAFTDYQIQLNAEYNKEYALAHGNNQKLIKEKSGHQEKEILDIIKKYKDLIFKECFGI
jgi:hypothetical protein